MRFENMLVPFAILAGITWGFIGERPAPINPTVEQAPIIRHRQYSPWQIQTMPTVTQDLVEPATPANVPKSPQRRLENVAPGATLDYRCGKTHGRCPSGTCCSSSGFCGTTKAHCRSPDCKIDYGLCDAHKTPKGPPTSDILRPHIGVVQYGPQQIRSCAVPGTVALTFDDGPSRYTGDLLDLLDKYEAPATFFVTGINNGKGAIDDPELPWASLISRMLLGGHQVASHTWSHEDLSKVTVAQRVDQMVKNEAALRNIMGSFPTYMRPPYSSCEEGSGCREDLGRMGYHIVLYDVDTDDYKNDNPGLIQKSKDIFDAALSSGNPASHSWLIIAHDAHEQTVHNLTEHMLQTMARLGYRPATVGECLRDSREMWYRKDSRWPGHKKTSTKTKPPQISIDGTCGKNYTCLGSSYGICCGHWNLCGNSSSHCGQGCQKDAGYCSVEVPHNGDAWDPSVPGKSSKSEADSDFRAVGTAAVVSLFLALIVAIWM
ncbi:Glycoside hydrolase/deacetylase beta/alpha-barrel [Penicillium verhagenii]|uniref:Glycoside hydrolase/deacetylase beta/alpha-barrel n=1 Tax=Penicillium verhagenii TaxID=1562060 RepID=UPI002544E910|nr:Glycoside hydrolase/deacetylase beta/alpha-barrel [Penicillium verhagenii]KAJ5918575.1 Glycoside hydrolase/deacetylase beta/alpha-barrel [Penicillium verhagenii]